VSGAGFLSEYFSGERAQALPRSVPHQLFSSAAVIHPLISGLLGLDGNAIDRTLFVRPRVPSAWTKTTWERYRVGDSVVSGEIVNAGGTMTVRLRVDGPPLRIDVEPEDATQSKSSHCDSCRVLEANFQMGRDATPIQLRVPEIGERAH